MAELGLIRFVNLPSTGEVSIERPRLSNAETSVLRSHASKVSHVRKRFTIGYPGKRGSGPHRFAARDKSLPQTRASREVQERQSGNATAEPNGGSAWQTINFLTTSQLDPFVQLPLDLSAQDKNLVHRYLMERISGWGTTPESPYCPARDTCLSGVIDNEVWLMQALIVTDAYSPSDESTGVKQQRILTRQATTYQLLRKWLASQEQRLSDAPIVGILVLGHMQRALGGPGFADIHWEAATNLIRERGGLRGFRAIQDFLHPTSQLLTLTYVGCGVTNVFETAQDFEAKGNELKISLSLIQDWNTSLRAEAGSQLSLNEGASNSGQFGLGHQAKALRSYLYIRQGVFGQGSLLRDYLQRSHGRPEVPRLGQWENRYHLGVIVALNLLLSGLRFCPEEASSFLNELDHTLRRTVETNTLSQVPGVMWMCTMEYCAQKLGLWKPRDDCFYRRWKIVESVDVIMSASLAKREKVIRAMSSWLTHDLEDVASLVILTESDLGEFVAEATRNWTLTHPR